MVTSQNIFFLALVEKKKVVDDISEGNKKVTEWAEGISKYFGIGRSAGEFLDAMKFFFAGPGYDLIPQIDWRGIKGYIETNDIRATRMVSDEVKSAEQFDDVSSTLTTLGDTMLKINQLDGGPGVSDKDKKEAERKKGIREDFNEAARKWYQEIVGNWYEGGALKQLEADKSQLIRYNEIIKTLSTKWVDIRGKDDRFTEVKLIHFNKEGKDSTIATEEGMIEMIERVKIRRRR